MEGLHRHIIQLNKRTAINKKQNSELTTVKVSSLPPTSSNLTVECCSSGAFALAVPKKETEHSH